MQVAYTAPDDPDVIGFGVGLPDPRLYPVETLDALLNALPRGDGALYNPAPAWGDPVLRETLSGWLRSRGIRVTPEEILVTTGGQQGLNVIARAFINPGDVVLTETPTYPGAFLTFRWAGADVVGVPVDHEGVRVDVLEESLARYRPKLLYLIPAFQNPTGAMLTAERRRRVLELALQYRVPVVESDLYGDLYFEQEPPPSLKAMDATGVVIYQGGGSKLGLPGLRVGWLVAPIPAMAALTVAKTFEDLHTAALTQRLAAAFIGSPHAERHLARLRDRVPDPARRARRRAPPVLPAASLPRPRRVVLPLGHAAGAANGRRPAADRPRARGGAPCRHLVQPERRRRGAHAPLLRGAAARADRRGCATAGTGAGARPRPPRHGPGVAPACLRGRGLNRPRQAAQSSETVRAAGLLCGTPGPSAPSAGAGVQNASMITGAGSVTTRFTSTEGNVERGERRTRAGPGARGATRLAGPRRSDVREIQDHHVPNGPAERRGEGLRRQPGRGAGRCASGPHDHHASLAPRRPDPDGPRRPCRRHPRPPARLARAMRRAARAPALGSPAPARGDRAASSTTSPPGAAPQPERRHDPGEIVGAGRDRRAGRPRAPAPPPPRADGRRASRGPVAGPRPPARRPRQPRRAR